MGAVALFDGMPSSATRTSKMYVPGESESAGIHENTPVSGWGRFLAAATLVLWFGAITAGRLMIYVG